MHRSTLIIAPFLLLLLAALSCGSTVFHPPGDPVVGTTSHKTFDPLSLPKDTTPREPFLDPTSLYSDSSYEVWPMYDSTSATPQSEQDAEFILGNKGLAEHIRAKVLATIAPGIGWLKPPMFHFRVDAQGAVMDVALISSIGNEDLDMLLVRTLSELPAWTPAKDRNGHAMDQNFTFTIVPGGC